VSEATGSLRAARRGSATSSGPRLQPPGLWARDWHCSQAVSLAAHASFLEPSAFHADEYTRRRPEETILYQVVAEHWPAFRERAEEAGACRD